MTHPVTDTIFSKLVEAKYLPAGYPVHAIRLQELRSTVGSGGFVGETSGIPSYMISIPGSHEANIPTTTLGDISRIPGVVVIPEPDGVLVSLVSDSADDTFAGTGAQEVEIVYLDSTGVQQHVTCSMGGLTPCDITGVDIQKVQWVHVVKMGNNANQVAQGNISLVDTGTGLVVYEYITAGGNQSLSAKWHVPSGGFGILFDWAYSGLKKRVDFYLRATVHREDRTLIDNGLFMFQDFGVAESSPGPEQQVGPLYLPPGSSVKISGKADIIGGEAGCSFGAGWIPTQ